MCGRVKIHQILEREIGNAVVNTCDSGWGWSPEKHKSQGTSETDRHINNDLKVKSSLHQLKSKTSIIFSVMEELHEQCNALGTTSGTPPNLANCFPYE